MRVRAAAMALALAVLGLTPAAPLAPAPAQAATDDCSNDDPLGLAGGFTEFIHGDAQRVSDSEGLVAYGGDAELGMPSQGIGFSIGSGQPPDSVGPGLPADPDVHRLIVGGTLDAFNVVVLGGGARYGDLAAGSQTPDAGGPVSQGPPTLSAGSSTPVDFDEEFADLTAKSNFWGELAQTGTISGASILTLEGAQAGLNVFHLTEAQFESAGSIRVKVPAGATILVNVDGVDLSMNAAALYAVEIWDPVTGQYITDDHFINGMPIPSDDWLRLRQSLLWNFPAATHILKNYVSFPGTVLAPQAAFEFGRGTAIGPGHIDGSLVAASVTSSPGAETHHMLFVGTCLPDPNPSQPGSLELVKRLSGPVAGASRTFVLQVDCSGTAYDQEVSITVAPGATEGSQVIPDLPEGLVCDITVAAVPEGWQLDDIVPASVVVAAGTTIDVIATNQRRLGSLRLVKALDGDPVDAPRTFVLHLGCDGTAFDQDVQLTVPDGSPSAAVTVTGLPVGLTCAVTEPNPGAGWELASIAPPSVVVGEGTPVTVTATNTRRLGSLTVEKVGTGDLPTDATDFQVDLDCTGTAYDQVVTVSVPGAPVTVSGLPLGLQCEVGEPDLPPGWSLVGVAPATVVVDDDAAVDVTVTNDFAAGSILLRKTSSEPTLVDTTFTISLDCDGTAYDQDVTILVPAGGTTAETTVDGFPVGILCAATEIDLPADWSEVSLSPSEVVVGSGVPVEIEAVNARDSAGLRILKQVQGDLVDAPRTFTMDVACSDGQTFTLLVGAPRGSAQSSGFIGGLTPGSTCTVTEADPTPEWGVVVNPQTVTIGALDTVVAVTFTNVRQLGSLQITKSTTGDPVGGTEVFRLKVDCTGTAYDQVVSLEVTFSRASQSATIDDLPVGLRCQVTEDDVPPGWELVGIVPDNGAVVVGADSAVEVVATNELGAGTLRLVKESVDEEGNSYPADQDTTFVLDVDCDRVGYDRRVSLTVAEGETSATADFAGIPAATTCHVTEVPTAGWAQHEITPDTVTVGDGTVATVTAVNTRLTGVVYVGKQVVGAPSPYDTHFRLHLDCTGTAYDQVVGLTIPALGREAIVPVSGVPFGSVCRITEPAQPPDWQFVEIVPDQLTVGPGKRLALLRSRDARPTGQLEIEKRVTEPVPQVTDFHFRVDCGGDVYDGEMVVSILPGSSTDNGVHSFVPVGQSCDITELPSDGWKLESATGNTDAQPGQTAGFVNGAADQDLGGTGAGRELLPFALAGLVALGLGVTLLRRRPGLSA